MSLFNDFDEEAFDKHFSLSQKTHFEKHYHPITYRYKMASH